MIIAALYVVYKQTPVNKLFEQFETSSPMPSEKRVDKISDIVSSTSTSLSDYTKYLSKILSFNPKAANSYASTDAGIVLFPTPSPTWQSKYTQHVRGIMLDVIEKYFKIPETLTIFKSAGFQGNVVMIPFDEFPESQRLVLRNTDYNGVFFNKLLKFDTYPAVFSSYVPDDYTITFRFVGNYPLLTIGPGAYDSIIAPAELHSITFSVYKVGKTITGNYSWEVTPESS
jgi:hypothetical protein